MLKSRLILFVAFMASMLTVSAQQSGGARFNPQKFEADLRECIVKEAALTPQECERFFPVYKEMRKKQHEAFERQRNVAKVKPADEEGCMKVVQERDNIELELKRIQKTYHNKFFEILPASKVYDVIQAEDKFHRSMLRQWGHRQKPSRLDKK